MTPNIFLMLVSSISLANVFFNHDLHSSLCFTVSVLSFVVAGILVPSKEAAKKSDIDRVFNALGKMDDHSKKEIEEMKKVVTELSNQVKGATSKITGLRMQIGLKD